MSVRGSPNNHWENRARMEKLMHDIERKNSGISEKVWKVWSSCFVRHSLTTLEEYKENPLLEDDDLLDDEAYLILISTQTREDSTAKQSPTCMHKVPENFVQPYLKEGVRMECMKPAKNQFVLFLNNAL